MQHLKPSPAMVVASIALFVALGGLGVAATKLKKNAVKTKNVKNSAITTKKIAKFAVTQDKIASGAVVSGKLGDSSVTSGKIATGAVNTNKFVATASQSVDFPNVVGNSCQNIDVAISGALATDTPLVGAPPSTPGFGQTPNGLTLGAFAQAGSVRLAACNPTATAQDPPAITVQITLLR
ncbi:MAG: hypothetical protein ACXWEF_04375 [Solirubrobacterales bacterium]